MEEIIAPIQRELIKKELTPERLLRKTNKASNEIYILNAHNAPNTMLEIGRLREEAFRHGGGGTGLSIDIDKFDTMPVPYQQLIVWNPEAEEIIGGYRYIQGKDVTFDEKGQPILATSHLFNFSDTFLKEYLPQTIELARSFVTVDYQFTTAGMKGLFALDNLWDGLGALMVNKKDANYFFGKMTIYPSFLPNARNMIVYFLSKYFHDNERLITPYIPYDTQMDEDEMRLLFKGNNFKEDYKILNTEVRKLGLNIPPLVNTYMNCSPTMKWFGVTINDEFGDVIESGILIAFDEIISEKRDRHIESYYTELRKRNG